MYKGVGLLEKARRVKQRFFGEVLQAAFVSTGTGNIQRVVVQRTTTQKGLLVGYGIGIALEIILLLSVVMVILVHYYSQSRRRPLNINRDPGSAAASMLMIAHDTAIREYFKGFDKIPEDFIKISLDKTLFRIFDNKLIIESNRWVKALNSMSPNRS